MMGIWQSRCLYSTGASIFLTFSYVASLYVWRSKLNRDHPATIKRRFFSVSCMMLLAPVITYNFLDQHSLNQADIYSYLGLRWSGLVMALTLPLALTAILFLGPLTMQFLSGTWRIYIEPWYWMSCWQDWVWVRNHVMAPLSEEWVFRACMLPLLVQCQYFETRSVIFMGPLLFGVAHFHHLHEQMKAGIPFKTALFISVFQFSYTSLFGAYSAYLFLRTGHFVAPLVAHMFCNHMGFPNFGEIGEYPPMQRTIIIFNFVLGQTALQRHCSGEALHGSGKNTVFYELKGTLAALQWSGTAELPPGEYFAAALHADRLQRRSAPL